MFIDEFKKYLRYELLNSIDRYNQSIIKLYNLEKMGDALSDHDLDEIKKARKDLESVREDIIKEAPIYGIDHAELYFID